MRRLTVSVAALGAAFGVALLPLLVVPFIHVAAEDQKGPVAALVLGAALVATGVVVAMSRVAFSVRSSALSLAGVPIVLVAAASALLTSSSQTVWFGEVFELGTVASYGLFALALFFAALVPTAVSRRALYVYVAAACVVGVVSVTASVLGVSSGLLANWPTVAAVAALALVCAATCVDWSSTFGTREWILTLASAVLFVCTLVYFNGVFVVAVLGVLAVSMLARGALFTLSKVDRLPLVSLLFALGFVASIALGLQSPLVEVSVDIRPSTEATQFVTAPLFIENPAQALVGSGPESFQYVWNKYRPSEFNQTALWNVSFKEGNSTAATLFVELGVLGVFAWLLPLLVLLVHIARRAAALTPLFVACMAGALWYYAASFFYTTGLVPMLVCGLLVGLAIQSLRSGPPPMRSTAPLWRFLAAGALGAAGLALVAVSVLQLRSMHYRTLGVAKFQTNELATAHELFDKAEHSWATPRLYADDTRTLLSLLQLATSTPSKEATGKPIELINRAINMDPNDLTVALTRASLFVTLAGSLRVADAKDIASSSVSYVSGLAPNRPETSYLQAVFAAHFGRMDEARAHLARTLDLKSDYEPALDLQRRLSGQ